MECDPLRTYRITKVQHGYFEVVATEGVYHFAEVVPPGMPFEIGMRLADEGLDNYLRYKRATHVKR